MSRVITGLLLDAPPHVCVHGICQIGPEPKQRRVSFTAAPDKGAAAVKPTNAKLEEQSGSNLDSRSNRSEGMQQLPKLIQGLVERGPSA